MLSGLVVHLSNWERVQALVFGGENGEEDPHLFEGALILDNSIKDNYRRDQFRPAL